MGYVDDDSCIIEDAFGSSTRIQQMIDEVLAEARSLDSDTPRDSIRDTLVDW